MKKQEIIERIADDVTVLWSGYGTWTVGATITLPRNDDDEDDEVITLSYITHNEDDKTGIFDGELYNPNGGFCSLDELDRAAQEECITPEAMLERIWSDTTNEDNYEPADERNMRLAESLYEQFEKEDIFYELNIES